MANCWAVQVLLQDWRSKKEFSLIVWRDRRSPIEPVNKSRVTELRPGDLAKRRRQLCEVVGLEVWR